MDGFEAWNLTAEERAFFGADRVQTNRQPLPRCYRWSVGAWLGDVWRSIRQGGYVCD